MIGTGKEGDKICLIDVPGTEVDGVVDELQLKIEKRIL